MSLAGELWEYDPIILEILWNRLIAITDEAAATLVRTSFSTIVRESNDYACVLLDPQGNSLAENRGSIPSFVGCMARTMRHFLRRFPLEAWEPGDVVITNDPWLATGHKPDITVATPIFYKGRLVAFAGSIAHSPDIGGSIWSADTREVYEEGLAIPPLKLMKAGKLNEEFMEILLANVRLPEAVKGDLYAQVAAGQVMGERLLDFLAEQGLEELTSFGEVIQARAEQAMRQAIAAVPDGVYRHAVNIDGVDQPLRIQATITIKGSELEVDYTGTSPQVDRGGINSVMNYTWAYTTYPIKCALDPTGPKNEGSYRPIKVFAPEGTIVNPLPPAPVNARQLVGHVLSAAIFGALAQAIPERVIADSGSAPSFRTLYTGIGHDGQKFSFILFANGGMGARPNADGLPCTPFPTNSTAASIEVMESLTPLVVWAKRIIPDSGGPGQYRGGYSQEIIVEVAAPQPITISVLSDRGQHPPQGLMGGLPGSPVRIRLLNREQPLPRKARATLLPGDLVSLCYAGGGGYGRPEARELARILEDLRNGVISPEAARQYYRLDERQLGPR